MRKLIIFSILLIFSLGLVQVVRAQGASLYLSPATGTFFVGSTFDVSIFVNTGGNDVNTVRVDLKFDPKKLQIVGPIAGKSFISVWVAQPTYSNIQGRASFQGGIPSPGINTSAGLVSTITFRAIAPGETIVSFLDSSRVLLDDGKGTNILTSTGWGVYTFSLSPPEGPGVFSSTHPDQNKWYKNNNPTFSWLKEEEIVGFSYSLDHHPRGMPDNIAEGDFTSISFSDLEDGVWYFHVKAKRDEAWGGASHYLVRIDSTPPASFIPKITPSTKTNVSQPIISFITTDALSGLEHFEIKVIDITPAHKEREVTFFLEAVSPHKLPVLEVGKYLVVVRAFDRAGNWRDESQKLEIIPKGIGFYREGVWFWGIFLPWWLLAILIALIVGLLVGILISWWKKHQKLQEEIKKKLRQRERKLKEHGKKIKIKVREIK